MKNNNQVWKMILLITQLGITMLTAIFICLFIGYYIDKWLGTKLMVWFIIVGVAAGVKSDYTLIKRYTDALDK